jgi:hypothetical protein
MVYFYFLCIFITIYHSSFNTNSVNKYFETLGNKNLYKLSLLTFHCTNISKNITIFLE